MAASPIQLVCVLKSKKYEYKVTYSVSLVHIYSLRISQSVCPKVAPTGSQMCLLHVT